MNRCLKLIPETWPPVGFPENNGNSNFGNLKLFLTIGGDQLLNENHIKFF